MLSLLFFAVFTAILLQVPESLLPSDLLTVSGVAVITAVIIQFLVKNPLKIRMGFINGDEPTEKQSALYSLYMNLIALFLALAFSFIAQAVFNSPFTGESLLLGFLNGLFGAVGATGISEYASNFNGYRNV